MVFNKLASMLAVAGLMVAGLQSGSKAQSLVTRAYASDTHLNLVATVRAWKTQGAMDPNSSFYFTDGNFNISGACDTLDVTTDAANAKHSVATGFGYYFIGAAFRWAAVQAHLTCNADGTSSVGLEVKDPATAEVLYTTGADVAGDMAELPIFRGRTMITPLSPQ